MLDEKKVTIELRQAAHDSEAILPQKKKITRKKKRVQIKEPIYNDVAVSRFPISPPI